MAALTAPTDSPPNAFGSAYSITRLLVLLCLTGFALAEPVLTSFGASPSTFIFYDFEKLSLLTLYGCLVAFAPGILLWLATCLASLISKNLGIAVFHLFVFLLAALWQVQLAKWSLGLDDPLILVLLACLFGGLFLISYLRFPVLKSGLRLAALAPLCFLAIFLFMSDTGSEISFRSEVEDVEKINRNIPSVVFILLDEFPTLGLINAEGSIEKERFPKLFEFSKVSTWYRHYTVTHGKTIYSVPSILSGGLPRSVAASHANYPDNLFSLLAPTHHLTAFESVTELCGLPGCSEAAPGVLPQQLTPQLGGLLAKTASLWLRRVSLNDMGGVGLGDFEESFTQVDNGEHRTPKMPRRLKKFIGTLVVGEPTLYFLHIQLPHVPWQFYGDGETYQMPYERADFEFGNRGGLGWMARVKEYRFLMQAQYTDSLLGHVFARLKSTGMWDDSLIVVTADHGRSFKLSAPSRMLTPKSVEGVAYAPLFIKLPEQSQGEIVDKNLLAYDLLPTIAQSLDIKVPWETAGYPANDSRITQRGDKKEAILRGKDNPVGDTFTYSDKINYPKHSSRSIGMLASAEDPLSLLNSGIEIELYLNRPVKDFRVIKSGTARVKKLRQLRNPKRDTPMGVVMGHLEFDSAAEKVLVAVNGIIVTGSPLIAFQDVERTFFAMLPQGSLGKENEITIYLIADDTLEELSLVAETWRWDDFLASIGLGF